MQGLAPTPPAPVDFTEEHELRRELLRVELGGMGVQALRDRAVSLGVSETALEALRRSREAEGRIYRVDPDFGSTLTVSYRDSQPNCWVN